MCSSCRDYEDPYVDHSFARETTRERHIVTPGYAEMDVEVIVYECTCGEQFGSKEGLEEHFEEEANDSH